MQRKKMADFRRFGAKELRHPQNNSDEKCYLYRSTRFWGEVTRASDPDPPRKRVKKNQHNNPPCGTAVHSNNSLCLSVHLMTPRRSDPHSTWQIQLLLEKNIERNVEANAINRGAGWGGRTIENRKVPPKVTLSLSP